MYAACINPAVNKNFYFLFSFRHFFFIFFLFYNFKWLRGRQEKVGNNKFYYFSPIAAGFLSMLKACFRHEKEFLTFLVRRLGSAPDVFFNFLSPPFHPAHFSVFHIFAHFFPRSTRLRFCCLGLIRRFN